MVTSEARSFPESLSAAGETGWLLAGLDWSAISIGPPENWPQSLKTAVDIMLASPRPVSVMWGPDRVQLYNDAYVPIAGHRHPGALGRSAAENWAEAYRSFLEPILDRVYGGEAVVIDDQPVLLRKPGTEALEERSFSASFRPIRDEIGRVAGVFHPLTETTARREAEAALRASEERLQLALDGADLGLWDLDLITDTATRSLRHDQMFGYSELQPSWGRAVAERHVLEDDAPLFRQAFERAVETGGLALEIRVRWPDGSVHWIAPKGRVFYDDIGRPVRMAGVVQDVTARRAAEEKARSTQAELAAIFDQATVGIAETDLTGRFVRVNDRYRQIVGRSRDELLRLRMHEITHPDDLGGNAPLFEDMAKRGRPFEIVKRYARPGGDTIWVHNNVAPIRSPDGLVKSVLAVTVDLTAQRGAEEALRESEARLRELNETLERRVADALAERQVLADFVDSTDAAVLACDLRFGILAINSATAEQMERIYGVRPKVGDSLLDVLGRMPEHRAQVEQHWGRALSGEEFMILEEFGDPGHERVSYEVRFHPLRDRGGKLIGAFQAAYDVTDRVRAQAELAHAQEALRQAQKMEAMGQLTGGIAHDFNNLLGAVVGSLDLIRRKPADVDRVQRYAEAGLQAAERGAKLTGQLLAFSRAQRLEQKPVIVSDLVAGMRDMLDRSLGPLARLTLDLRGDGATLSDPTQLEMAVLNLAINARDAMPEGGELSIGTAVRQVRSDAELKPGEYIELSVTDTGVGMPPEVVARAFDPFFTTKGVGKGTGLGLSQVYGLARQTGGTVRIESEPGQGTTVRILLPKTSLNAQLAPDARADGQEAAGFATVLVIDDDSDVRRVLVDSLEALGYRVVEAPDGPAGLAELERSTPDLMMVDFAMPGMNGAEVAKAARRRRPDLPIVFASGYADTAAIEEVVGTDAVVLRKPFRIDDLQKVLAASLYDSD